MISIASIRADEPAAVIDSELNARIDSFELAFRMQTETAEIFDVGRDGVSSETLWH